MSLTSSYPLTICSSSTLANGKAQRQSQATTLQCLSLPYLSSPLLHSQSLSWNATPFCGKRSMRIASSTTEEVTTEEVITEEVTTEAVATKSITDVVVESIELPNLVNTIQQTWDKVEDKYAVSTLGVAALLALWGSAGVISAIDRLPLVPGVLEIVGLGYTAWFGYRNLVFRSERRAFVRKIKETYGEITGSSYSKQ